MEAILPDCTELELRLTLIPEEEEELLQEVAEHGKDGLKRFSDRLSAKWGSGEMAEKLRRYREKLDAQAARMLAQRKARYHEDDEEGRARIMREMDEYRKTRPHVIPDLERIDLLDLEDLMEKDDLLRLIKDEGPDTLWDRIRSFFLRIRIWLRQLWMRFRNLFRRGKKGPGAGGPRKKRMTLALFGGKTRFNIGVPVSELLRRPRFRQKLRDEMGQSGELSPDELEERTEEVLEQHLEAAVRREMARSREIDEAEQRNYGEREEEKLRELEDEHRNDQLRREEELNRLKDELRKRTEDPVKRLVERNLIELGFIQQEGDDIIPTTALLERFAELIFQKELNALPSSGARSGVSEKKLGIYEKAKLRSVHEESRMDIVTTVVNTRINHPGDRHMYKEDIMVHREESAISSHVVIMFDKSSSMEENHRMDAAKRTAMALYRAVKRQKEKDRIDIIGFDTHVSLMDLMSVWNASPGGFTNISGALRTARLLFDDSRADIKIAYMITDGLPEAYTDENGRDVAGEPGLSMDHALGEARELDAHFTLILLEPEEESFVDAGKRISQEAEGKLIISNPRELMHDVLGDYLG